MEGMQEHNEWFKIGRDRAYLCHHEGCSCDEAIKCAHVMAVKTWHQVKGDALDNFDAGMIAGYTNPRTPEKFSAAEPCIYRDKKLLGYATDASIRRKEDAKKMESIDKAETNAMVHTWRDRLGFQNTDHIWAEA